MLLIMKRTFNRLAKILRIRTYCVHVHVRHHLYVYGLHSGYMYKYLSSYTFHILDNY
jgi:hypothetical protein